MTARPTQSVTPSRAAVIFAARETPDLLSRTITAVESAVPTDTVVDVMVNGQGVLAAQIVKWLEGRRASDSDACLRVWHIPMPDKANAWNQYLHRIWSGEEIAYFIDGYARPRPDAIACLNRCMADAPQALAGTGVPSVGRSAAAIRRDLLEWGGLHGNLCCLRASGVEQFRALNIWLPQGHYRTDSLLSSILYFGFDPRVKGWDFSRIVTCPDATWDVDEQRWWHPDDLKDVLGRRMRQARGVLENAAVRDWMSLRHQSPSGLPRHSSSLLHTWMASNPAMVRDCAQQSLLVRWALWSMQRRMNREANNSDPHPTLMWQSSPKMSGLRS